MSEPIAVPEPCDLVIEAGWVIPVEPHGLVLEDHAVAVRGGVILAILPIAERARDSTPPKPSPVPTRR